MNDEPFTPHPNLSDDINRNLAASEIAGGAWLKDLPVGHALAIQTRNTQYILRKVSADGFTLASNGNYCPTPTVAYPHGSTWGGSMLKIGYVGRGMFFECGLEGVGTITTSEIQDVTEIRR